MQKKYDENKKTKFCGPYVLQGYNTYGTIRAIVVR